MSEILLHCDHCGYEVNTPRQDFDPVEAVTMHTNECTECDAALGGFESSYYLDKNSHHVEFDL